MKITTQRSLLWTLNFVIVFALIGCVLLMVTKSGPKRRADEESYRRQIEETIDGVTVRRSADANSEQPWARFKTALDKEFHFEGYVKPPEVEKPTVGPKVENAPPLAGLITVTVVLAPTGEGGPATVTRGGAGIKINSKKPNQKDDGIYFYEVGDVLGIGQEFRDDKDPQLEKWGPCRLLEVRPDAIICSWNKDQDQAEVKVSLAAPVEGEIWVQGPGNTVIGSEAVLHGKEEIKGGGVVDSGKLTKSTQVADKTLVTWTQEGLEALGDEGEKLLDQVEVESAQGGDGLKIKSLPSRLSEFGIREGDVIVQIDSQPVKNKESAVNYVRKTYRSKSHYNVTVLRDGRTRQIQVDVPKKLSDAKNVGGNVRFGK
ncbi:MAG: PDZ domain-containing protein [Planctomycetes bacterium]|nr:PDZ domain-containing protein [Planctomycetota bacterium]